MKEEVLRELEEERKKTVAATARRKKEEEKKTKPPRLFRCAEYEEYLAPKKKFHIFCRKQMSGAGARCSESVHIILDGWGCAGRCS